MVLTAFLIAITVPRFGAAQGTDLASIAGGIRVYPGSFWSSTNGIGVGLGYKFDGITGSTSSLLLVAKPQIHRGIYEVSYVTRDPYGNTPYVGAAVYYEDTGRTRYYGIGPFTTSDGRVFVKDQLLRIRLRGGLPFGDGRWVVQPVAEFWNVATDTFRNDDARAFEAMDEVSRGNLTRAVAVDGAARYAGGGIEAGWYFARDPEKSGSGVQATLERLEPLNGDGSGFWRASGLVLMDEAVGSRQVIARLAFGTILGSSEDVPYYLLPRLGGRLLPGYAKYRFRGHTKLVMNVALEQPLFEFMGYGGVDLVLAAGLGGVYDDFFDQFTPRVSFEKKISPGSSAPLRPAAGAGFRFYVGERPLEVTVLGGISPERMSLVTFRVHRDIRHRQGLLFR